MLTPHQQFMQPIFNRYIEFGRQHGYRVKGKLTEGWLFFKKDYKGWPLTIRILWTRNVAQQGYTIITTLFHPRRKANTMLTRKGVFKKKYVLEIIKNPRVHTRYWPRQPKVKITYI